MKHHWHSLEQEETSRTIKEKKGTNERKHGRKHGRTNWVTTSLLELLIAAKNKQENKSKSLLKYQDKCLKYPSNQAIKIILTFVLIQSARSRFNQNLYWELILEAVCFVTNVFNQLALLEMIYIFIVRTNRQIKSWTIDPR